jgi:type VI secretion system protein ImpF
MAGHDHPRIVPSVLDRLILPAYDGTIGSLRPDSLEQLRASVARDLRALLNTRREEELIPKEFAEASSSILNFGLPDFLSYALRVPSEQARLRRTLENVIRTFEPRLSNIQVAITGWDDNSTMLRFRVDGVLKVEPVGEPVAYEATLQTDSGKFSVRGQG